MKMCAGSASMMKKMMGERGEKEIGGCDHKQKEDLSGRFRL
jgi:hypothetical protein